MFPKSGRYVKFSTINSFNADVRTSVAEMNFRGGLTDCITVLVTFTGDGVSWTDAANWNGNIVPTCENILMPTGYDVIVPNNLNAAGLSLTVKTGLSLLLGPLSTLEMKK